MDFARVDALAGKGGENGGILLLKKRFEQMLGAYVVMVVIATLLLCGAQYATRGGAKSLKQGLLSNNFRGDTI